MSSTNRSDAREQHPNDLYQTPHWVITQAIAAGALVIDDDEDHWFWEPCAGQGMIVEALISSGLAAHRIFASDINLGHMPDGVELTLTLGEANGYIDLAELDNRTCLGRGRLTVVTNPPYRVPDRAAMLGFEGAELDARIPRVKSEKHPDGTRSHFRDGVALTFWAADYVGASVIALVTRVSWWTGCKKRMQLRQMIRREWTVEIWSTCRRVRFIKPDGELTRGNDSCEHCLIVLKRRTVPLTDAELQAVPLPAQARDQHIEFVGWP